IRILGRVARIFTASAEYAAAGGHPALGTSSPLYGRWQLWRWRRIPRKQRRRRRSLRRWWTSLKKTTGRRSLFGLFYFCPIGFTTLSTNHFPRGITRMLLVTFPSGSVPPITTNPCSVGIKKRLSRVTWGTFGLTTSQFLVFRFRAKVIGEGCGIFPSGPSPL